MHGPIAEWKVLPIQQWVSVSTASHKHTLTSVVHKLKWAKNRGEISLLTDYRIFWYPQIRYKLRPICHWVSKLSQKWLLKVKNGMKSDNNRSHVNKFFHLGLWIGNFAFTLHWLQVSSAWFKSIVLSLTHSHLHTDLPDSVKEYNLGFDRKLL